MADEGESAFYEKLFTKEPTWSTPWPNPEEVPRAAIILSFLTSFASHLGEGRTLNVLDMGCGRGWLTHMVQAYGKCLGVDPIGPVVDHARALFPNSRFCVGTTSDLLPDLAGTFDVVILSEVIEHVPEIGRDAFLNEIRSLLNRTGVCIITTDRGELYNAWAKRQPSKQPVEEWLTERELRDLFESRGFRAVAHDRIYWDTPNISWLHRATASPRAAAFLAAIRQRWLLHGMRYLAAFGQAWMFAARARDPSHPHGEP